MTEPPLKHEVAILGEEKILAPQLHLACGGDRGHPAARRISEASRNGLLRCAVCKTVVRRMFGSRNRWHFAVAPGQVACDHENETVEHHETKLALFDGEDEAAGIRERAVQIASDLRVQLTPLLNTTLYLCAANAEISAADGSERRPANPVPKRTKKRGEKLFAAQEVREWDVAYRLGAALRRARSETDDARPPGEGGAGRTMRAHVRRAH